MCYSRSTHASMACSGLVPGRWKPRASRCEKKLRSHGRTGLISREKARRAPDTSHGTPGRLLRLGETLAITKSGLSSLARESSRLGHAPVPRVPVHCPSDL